MRGFMDNRRQHLINIALWDGLTELHQFSPLYDLEGFRKGRTSLRSVEKEELGNVADKSMLHLQCHFGLDTLSWASLGAQVVGVDFSKKSIALANSLRDEMGLKAKFICSDVYEL